MTQLSKIITLSLALLATNSFTQAQDAIHVSDMGKVGIGNNDPKYKLDVNGNIKATSDIVTDGSVSAKGIRATGNIVTNDSLITKSIKATSDIVTDGNLRVCSTHIIYNSPNGVIDWGENNKGALIFRTVKATKGSIGDYEDRMLLSDNGLNVKGNIQADANVILGCTNAPNGKKGFMGIGTTTPQVPLSVTITKGGTGNIGYANDGSNIAFGVNAVVQNDGGRNYGNCSIYGLGDIVTNNVLVSTSQMNYSDIRLKKDIHLTSSANDLATLRRIEVVDYKMIDTIADNKRYKKVIAQQVQKVYPQAVSPYSYYLPSVFQPATSVENEGDGSYKITVTADHHLAAGDQVKLKCYPGGDVIVTVKEIPAANQFIAISETEIISDSSVFVYGKETDDLLTVDYSALSMLNVSATQELIKIIEAQQKKIAQLEQAQTMQQVQNKQLMEENTTMKTSFESFEARINSLETKVNETAVPVTALK